MHTDIKKPIRSISVVIPTFNEEGNVYSVYKRLTNTVQKTGLGYEIIFSLDPCTDNTEAEVKQLASEDRHVKMVMLSRRFGQPAATIAGLSRSTGDACVVIDCDLQDPPELILQMLEKLQEGYEVVYAQRRSRKGETLTKRIVANLGYRVIKRVADIDIPPNTGDFRLMTRRVVNEVLGLKEKHGFLRGLVATVGYRQTSVLYDRDMRVKGSGKYNKFIGSMLIGLNGLIGFSRYPLHVISLSGIGLSLFAFILAVTYMILKIAGVDFPTGNPTIVIIVSFFSGIQLLSLGIMGEYVGRIYDEVKNRPMFIVDYDIGFDEGADRSSFQVKSRM